MNDTMVNTVNWDYWMHYDEIYDCPKPGDSEGEATIDEMLEAGVDIQLDDGGYEQ